MTPLKKVSYVFTKFLGWSNNSTYLDSMQGERQKYWLWNVVKIEFRLYANFLNVIGLNLFWLSCDWVQNVCVLLYFLFESGMSTVTYPFSIRSFSVLILSIRVQFSDRNVVVSVFKTWKRILLVDIISKGIIVNAAAYCLTLKRMRKKIKRKRKGMLTHDAVTASRASLNGSWLTYKSLSIGLP